MANTIRIDERLDGELKYIIDVYISGDGTGDESDTVFIDFSGLHNPHDYQDLALQSYMANLTGFSASLSWDATTNVPFQEIVEGDSGFDYQAIGGPRVNTAGTGKTGDVLISTTGLGSGDTGTIRMEWKKHNGSRTL